MTDDRGATEPAGPGVRRRPPRERFAGAEHLFDLEAAAEALAREPVIERDGHRQVTLYREDALTVILFDFEAGGRLRDHSAHGVVMVQVLSGDLRMTTPDGEHVMPAGSLLVLRPDVHHDVLAERPSRMLLTVCLSQDG